MLARFLVLTAQGKTKPLAIEVQLLPKHHGKKTGTLPVPHDFLKTLHLEGTDLQEVVHLDRFIYFLHKNMNVYFISSHLIAEINQSLKKKKGSMYYSMIFTKMSFCLYEASATTDLLLHKRHSFS